METLIHNLIKGFNPKLYVLVAIIVLCSCSDRKVLSSLESKEKDTIPYLRKQGTAIQLIVHNKPFLIIGGELHNSSSSSIEYMKPLWPRIVEAHVNTLLVVVSWALTEPEEGKFDFSMVDGIIEEAREYNLKLILLWFGSWKNGVSTYTPAWIKNDQERFPLVKDINGNSLEILSTFGKATMEADAKAFAALMKHLKEVDSKENTVIMIQVQNEVGVRGDSRDRSQVADEAYNDQVPEQLINYLVKHKDQLMPELKKVWQENAYKTLGTWEEIFGTNKPYNPDWCQRSFFTDEIFMSWYYACFIQRMVELGKAEYPLPMFVNAWLSQPECPQPGQYPSGGPLPYVMDVWKAAAPEIDMYTPDIHNPYFEEWCAWYDQSGNPLFIPEARRDMRGAVAVFHAMGMNNAMGYSPFAIERIAYPEHDITKSYDIISRVQHLILRYQGTGMIGGAVLTPEQQTKTIRLGGYDLILEFARHWSFESPEYASAFFFNTAPEEFIVVGRGMKVTFNSVVDIEANVGFSTVDEGNYVDGKWVPGRRLNGDEILSGTALRLPGDYYSIQQVKLYIY